MVMVWGIDDDTDYGGCDGGGDNGNDIEMFF